ncbi:nuclear transport factor 2 family protein [Colwellia sp. TT2012]|uniref:nuclear transport factor 2 family protein n=1 Tax=Colwellia sp. TT2012 TaxID=1720342 RepID=UPI00070DB760|nr:ester cyclase [Colwellia sp. TT2012]
MNIFKLGSIALVITTLSACGGSDSPTTPPTAKVAIPADVIAVSVNGEFCTSVACEDSNKIVIEQIYNDIINGGNSGLVTSIYNENFTHHNSTITAGIEGQTDYFNTMFTDKPDSVATIKHIVADGDYVAVHWHYSDNPENEFIGQANIDLYKLKDELIVEQWNKSMSPNESTASGNSVFSDLYDYGNSQPNNDIAIEEDNRSMVKNFYLDLFNNQNLSLIDTLLDPNYLQHNFWVPNGSAALRNFVSGGTSGNLTIFLTLAEDDLVWTFSGSGTGNLGGIDLWRVDNNTNKIVEHWDVF